MDEAFMRLTVCAGGPPPPRKVGFVDAGEPMNGLLPHFGLGVDGGA